MVVVGGITASRKPRRLSVHRYHAEVFQCCCGVRGLLFLLVTMAFTFSGMS